jgi:type 1 glutamine amidotransferase
MSEAAMSLTGLRRPFRASFVGAALLAAVAAAGLLPGAAAEDKKAEEKVKPIRALLVIGGCCHDYAKQKDILAKGLTNRTHVEVTVAYDPDTTTKHLNPVYEKPDWAKDFDVIIHDECSSDVKDLDVINRILEPHRQGLPAVVLHCGMHCYRSEGYPKATPWFEFTGLATTAHGAQLPIAITFTDKDSPITKGMKDWSTGKEELYNNITGKLLDTAQPLARGKQAVGGGKEDDYVVAWTNTYNRKTRVFATTLGHNNETVRDPRYLDLVTRGLLWSVDKLDDKHLKPYDPSQEKPEKPEQSKEPPKKP